LGKLGAKRINDYTDATDTKPGAIQCRLHYEATRDSLLRSHWWRFASARAELSQDTETPDFEWDYQFKLPNDFLAMKSIYEDRYSNENLRSYALEGKMLLTNEDEMSIRYIKKVTDVTQFDPLFVKVLVLLLADEMIGPLAGGDEKIQRKIDRALEKLMPKVWALDRQETNTEGEYSLETWNDARYS
ncbi:MAG: hypothetical protein ACYS6W_17855, partial [Planctomycetota bacterium]